jgi:type VI secretion system protein
VATLLERIINPQRTTRTDVGELRDSVILHLKKLLNTRQGSVPIHPEYGMPDLSEFINCFPESITKMQTTIASIIEKFEPRLKSVRVDYKENPDDVLNIKFEITAQLVVPDQDQQSSCYFETTIGTSGHIEIEG